MPGGHGSVGVETPLLGGWQLLRGGANGGSVDKGRRQGKENADARNILLSFHATDGRAANHASERVLDSYAKSWRCRQELSADPQLLLYELRLNRGVSPNELVTGVETYGASYITNVGVSATANDL